MKIIASLLFVFVVATATASEESHKAAVEKLFDTLQMKRQYETGLLQGFNVGASFSDDKLATLPIEQQNKIKAGMEKVRAKMLELMGWDSVKDDMATIYMKHFSEEEVTAITTMLDTPTGKLLITKQIDLLPETMTLGQKKAQAMMPEIMQIMQNSMQ